MPSLSPIRLLLSGSRSASRKSVRAAISAACDDFLISEISNTQQMAAAVRSRTPHAVVLVYPELHELCCDYLENKHASFQHENIPVIVVGRSGTNALRGHSFHGVDAYIPLQDVRKLPQIVNELAASRGNLRAKPGHHEAHHEMSTEALRESQKLISIGRLTAEISHEINNPLESVGNLLYLAQCEVDLSERAREYLRSAERELARVVQISKQTLSFYRESAQPGKVHMAGLMDEVVELYSRRIAGKKLDVRRDYAADEGITALPGEIRQVLSNLVTNAIEASALGGRLFLRIHPSHRWENGIRCKGLRVTVADTGAGIPADALKRLGELFFTTKGQSGTGLGLFVTRTIVNRYGGAMQVRSQTSGSNSGGKHGTVFSLFLPFDPAPVQQPQVAANQTVDRRKNVTEISQHPSHNHNHPSIASRHEERSGYQQKRNG